MIRSVTVEAILNSEAYCGDRVFGTLHCAAKASGDPAGGGRAQRASRSTTSVCTVGMRLQALHGVGVQYTLYVHPTGKYTVAIQLHMRPFLYDTLLVCIGGVF